MKRRRSATMRRILFALAVLMIPVTIVGLHHLIGNQFAEARGARATAEEAATRRDQLAQMLTLHLDVQTGVRGYVLTSQAGFLEPYVSAIPERDALFKKLREDVAESDADHLDTLYALSERMLALAALNVEDVGRGRADLARERIALGDGKQVMDEIRTLITEMDAIEAERLTALGNANAGSPFEVERTIDLTLGTLTLLLIIIAFTLWRSVNQRQKALEEVRTLARRQEAMFDGAVDGMLWLDDEGNIIRLNPSISRMFGYSEDELLGRHNMFLMEEDYSHEVSVAWLRSVGESGVDGAGKRQEFTGVHANGSTFETEVAISLVPGDQETESSYVASIRDISHRKRAERMKTEFVSTVSHELRTPLTSIAGSLGLLLGGAAGQLEPKMRHLISIAHSNCERLIRLINDILDIEKIESGKMEFDIRRMQVAPLARRTEEAMVGFAEKHDVQLKVEMPPWPQCIMGDPDRLDQLLTNLVSNAIKHSPAGETVEVHCDQKGDFARIEVRDRGAGIPEDFRKRIFGKFAMADASDSRTRGGTGLGLSIAREIARRHEGDIGFSDREGGGTVFYVDIPLAAEQAVQTHPTKSDAPMVLHLDDDADCLSIVAESFGARAMVLSATNLPEARVLVRERKLAAAIIDVGLGEESGLSLVSEVRALDPSLPILLFTAIDDTYEVEGVDRVLVKSKASFDDLVRETLDLVRHTDPHDRKAD